MLRAELEKTETLLRYAILTAPFAGIITARFVDPGAFVPAGVAGGASAMVTLADTKVLRAQVLVPEAEAILVKTGQPVRISVEGLAKETFTATISRHSGALDETSRTLLVEADLPNSTGTLRPGMYANIRLGVERHPDAWLIPTEAIVMEKLAGFVYRVDQGQSRKTPVKLGFQDGPTTEIISGLAEDTVVVIPGKIAPAEGAAVRAKESK